MTNPFSVLPLEIIQNIVSFYDWQELYEISRWNLLPYLKFHLHLNELVKDSRYGVNILKNGIAIKNDDKEYEALNLFFKQMLALNLTVKLYVKAKDIEKIKFTPNLYVKSSLHDLEFNVQRLLDFPINDLYYNNFIGSNIEDPKKKMFERFCEVLPQTKIDKLLLHIEKSLEYGILGPILSKSKIRKLVLSAQDDNDYNLSLVIENLENSQVEDFYLSHIIAPTIPMTMKSIARAFPLSNLHTLTIYPHYLGFENTITLMGAISRSKIKNLEIGCCCIDDDMLKLIFEFIPASKLEFIDFTGYLHCELSTVDFLLEYLKVSKRLKNLVFTYYGIKNYVLAYMVDKFKKLKFEFKPNLEIGLFRYCCVEDRITI